MHTKQLFLCTLCYYTSEPVSCLSVVVVVCMPHVIIMAYFLILRKLLSSYNSLEQY